MEIFFPSFEEFKILLTEDPNAVDQLLGEENHSEAYSKMICEVLTGHLREKIFVCGSTGLEFSLEELKEVLDAAITTESIVFNQESSFFYDGVKDFSILSTSKYYFRKQINLGDNVVTIYIPVKYLNDKQKVTIIGKEGKKFPPIMARDPFKKFKYQSQKPLKTVLLEENTEVTESIFQKLQNLPRRSRGSLRGRSF